MTDSHPKPPRVAICDDHRVVAESFRRMLRPTYAVVGAVATGEELRTLLGTADVDIAA